MNLKKLLKQKNKQSQQDGTFRLGTVLENVQAAFRKVINAKALLQGIEITSAFLQHTENIITRASDNFHKAFLAHGDVEGFNELHTRRASHIEDLNNQYRNKENLESSLKNIENMISLMDSGRNAVEQPGNHQDLKIINSYKDILEAGSKLNESLDLLVADIEVNRALDEVEVANEKVESFNFFDDDDDEPDQDNENDNNPDDYSPPPGQPPADQPPPDVPPPDYQPPAHPEQVRPPAYELHAEAKDPSNAQNNESPPPAYSKQAPQNNEAKPVSPASQSSASLIFQRLGARPAVAVAEVAAAKAEQNAVNVNEQKPRQVEQKANEHANANQAEEEHAARPNRRM